MVAVQAEPFEVSLEALESILAADQSQAPAQWARRFRDALGEMTRALSQHLAVAESPGGALSTLESSKQQTLATLDHAVHHLRQDYLQLMTGARDLWMSVQRLALSRPQRRLDDSATAEMVSARQDGEKLLHRLREHQEAERTLLMDTINTDVGVGD